MIDEMEGMDAPTVLLKDEVGRSILCYLEHTFPLEGKEYCLLQPVDAPVVFFKWDALADDDDEEDEEDGEPILVEEEKEIETIFSTARAVLSEQNLTLLWTAVTLTVEGDLPEIDDLDPEDADVYGEEGDELEEFQLLASFFHDDQEYVIYTPVEPFLIVARMEGGEPKLLAPDEYEAIEPFLEEQLAAELDV